MKYIIMYLVVINLIAFLTFGLDKNKAVRGGFRISEGALLLYSLFGGGVGSMIGMKLFRHKTQKFKFRFGVPFLTLMSIVELFFIYNIFL